jgi:hypothetical protein
METVIMSEQTVHTTTQPDAVPARIDLEDFIEAVTRGVARALAATGADVSGYSQLDGGFAPGVPPVLGQAPIFVGFVAPAPSGPSGPFVPREVPIRR